MQDSKYCYPESNVLKNKLNITDGEILFNAEKELTYIRLMELQSNPIKGKFDYKHLLKIHHYIFQDVYDWAGKLRTVEIGKGNLFCTTKYLKEYGEHIFSKYYNECNKNKNDLSKFIKIFASNYADLNALHPFREGNGRTQREFARLICLECNYAFDLSCTSHKEMLDASINSFEHGDNSGLESIFSKAIIPIEKYKDIEGRIKILTADDLIIGIEEHNMYYDYYEEENNELINKYNEIYLKKSSDNKNI